MELNNIWETKVYSKNGIDRTYKTVNNRISEGCTMRKTFFIIGFLIIIGFSVFGGGGRQQPNFVIANGTGYTIKSIEIRPSAIVYPGNNAIFSVSDHDIVDKGFVEIFLGDDMLEYTYFDMSIQYDSDLMDNRESIKRVRTGEALNLNSRNKVPVFSLSIKGERNTLEALGSGVAALVTSIMDKIPIIHVDYVDGFRDITARDLFITAFGPLVPQDLVTEELGDYSKVKRTLGNYISFLFEPFVILAVK